MKDHTRQALERLGAPWRTLGCVVLSRRGTRLVDLTATLGLEDEERQVAARVAGAAPSLYTACRMLASLPRDNPFVRQYPAIWEAIREAVEKAEGAA
jgi:hypothetical protein